MPDMPASLKTLGRGQVARRGWAHAEEASLATASSRTGSGTAKPAQREKREGSGFPGVQTPTEGRGEGVGDGDSGQPLLSTPQRPFLRVAFFRVT